MLELATAKQALPTGLFDSRYAKSGRFASESEEVLEVVCRMNHQEVLRHRFLYSIICMDSRRFAKTLAKANCSFTSISRLASV